MGRNDDLVRVVLLALPVDVHARASEHMDALQREFELIRLSEAESNSVPQRLHALVTQLDEEFGGLNDEPRAELQRAMDQRVPSIDLEYLLPPAAADASQRLSELIDDADEYCRQGKHLLTLASTPEALAYRRWFLGQIDAQIAGQPPTPWPDHVWSDDGRVPVTEQPDSDEAPVPLSLPEGWAVGGNVEEPILVVGEDLDLHSAPVLREAITHLVRTGARHITIDLVHTPFVDSVGLSVLVSAHARLGESGATLSLIAPANVRRVISLSGLDGILDIEPAG